MHFTTIPRLATKSRYHIYFSETLYTTDQIPYSIPKFSDFFLTLLKTILLETHTLYSGTYPYSLYMRVGLLYYNSRLCLSLSYFHLMYSLLGGEWVQHKSMDITAHSKTELVYRLTFH